MIEYSRSRSPAPDPVDDGGQTKAELRSLIKTLQTQLEKSDNITQRLLAQNNSSVTPFTQESFEDFTSKRKPKPVAQKPPDLAGGINSLMQLSFMGMQDPARRGAQLTYARQLAEAEVSDRIKQPYSRTLDEYEKNEIAKLKISDLLDVNSFLDKITVTERPVHEEITKLYNTLQDGMCAIGLTPQEQSLQSATMCRIEEHRHLLEKLCLRLDHFADRMDNCPKELRDAVLVFNYILNDLHSEMGLFVLINTPINKRNSKFLAQVEKTHTARMKCRPTKSPHSMSNIDGNFIEVKKDAHDGYIKRFVATFQKYKGQEDYASKKEVDELLKWFRLNDLKEAGTTKGFEKVKQKHRRENKQDKKSNRDRSRSYYSNRSGNRYDNYRSSNRRGRGRGRGRGKGRGRRGRGGNRPIFTESDRRKLKASRLWKSDHEMSKMNKYEKREHARKQRECLNRR